VHGTAKSSKVHVSDTHLGVSTQQARHTRELQVPCSPYTVIMRHSGVGTRARHSRTGTRVDRTGTCEAQHYDFPLGHTLNGHRTSRWRPRGTRLTRVRPN